MPMQRYSLTALMMSAVLIAGCSGLPASLQTPAEVRSGSTADEAEQCAEHVRDLASHSVKSAAPAESSSRSLDAQYWCTKAAEHGDGKSQYALAGMYERGAGVARNPQEAIRWYQASARSGYAPAQFKVGRMYGRGEGVPMDRNAATRWYMKAAEQGYPDAQYYMGYRYEHGKGTAQSHAEALRWYGKAAEQGNVSAMDGLGSMYQAGHGVPQNHVEAYKWFNLAAVSGEPEFVAHRDRLAAKLTPAQLAEGQRLASEWAKTHTINKTPTR